LRSLADNRKYVAMAESFVDLDSRIYSCLIVHNPSGAMLGEATKPEMRNNLGSLSEKSGGMVGQWGILAFKAMSRLDGVRSKAKYIVVGREKFNAIIFPLESDQDLIVGLTFDAAMNPREIFAEIMKSLESNSSLLRM